jgi:hypothetical protein
MLLLPRLLPLLRMLFFVRWVSLLKAHQQQPQQKQSRQ